MELHGVTGAPYKHPQVRRTVPTFARQRIDLDSGGRRVKRVWQDISVLAIAAGDVIAGFGRVENFVEYLPQVDGQTSTQWRVRLYNVDGVWKDFGAEQRVFAFSVDQK